MTDLSTQFKVIQGDITRSSCDAIMASFNPRVHSTLQESVCRAAGKAWTIAMITEGEEMRPGDAWIVDVASDQLFYRNIYMCHTPDWHTNSFDADRSLVYCYRNVLNILDTAHIRSLAVPLLATGAHKYPNPRAVRLAVRTVVEHTPSSLEQVEFTALDNGIISLTQERLAKVLAEPGFS